VEFVTDGSIKKKHILPHKTLIERKFEEMNIFPLSYFFFINIPIDFPSLKSNNTENRNKQTVSN